MKVKFIEENPKYEIIGIWMKENCLELDEIYDAEYDPDGYFGGTEFTDSYKIDGFDYPAPWFQIIEQ